MHATVEEQVFLPDVSALRPGDMVLTRNLVGSDGRKQDALILAATQGDFSHVLICTSPPTLMEAVGSGVMTRSLARCFAHHRRGVQVLRYPKAEVAAAAASRAQLELGRPYSVRKAIASVGPSIPTLDSDEGIFCSALVARVFTAAGAAEFASLHPEKTTPATLQKMPGLLDVTDEVFHLAPTPRNVATLTALDGDHLSTPSAAQSEISARYAAELLPSVRALQQDHPEFGTHELYSLNDCIQFIVSAMDQADLEGPPGKEALARLSALDATTARLLNSGELAALYASLEEIEAEQIRLAFADSFKLDPDIDIPAMRHLLLTGIEELAKREAAAAEFRSSAHRSQTAAAWADLQEKVNPTFRARNVAFREIIDRVED